MRYNPLKYIYSSYYHVVNLTNMWWRGLYTLPILKVVSNVIQQYADIYNGVIIESRDINVTFSQKSIELYLISEYKFDSVTFTQYNKVFWTDKFSDIGNNAGNVPNVNIEDNGVSNGRICFVNMYDVGHTPTDVDYNLVISIYYIALFVPTDKQKADIYNFVLLRTNNANVFNITYTETPS